MSLFVSVLSMVKDYHREKKEKNVIIKVDVGTVCKRHAQGRTIGAGNHQASQAKQESTRRLHKSTLCLANSGEKYSTTATATQQQSSLFPSPSRQFVFQRLIVCQLARDIFSSVDDGHLASILLI